MSFNDNDIMENVDEFLENDDLQEEEEEEADPAAESKANDEQEKSSKPDDAAADAKNSEPDFLAKAEQLEADVSKEDDAEDSGKFDMKSVYVGQLHDDVVLHELQEHFAKCGPIARITIMTNRYTGASKGYGYIEFKTEEGAFNALRLDGSELRGQEIKVVLKRHNIPRAKRGGRGRGRGGSRGGYRGRGFHGRGRGRGRGGYRGRGRGRGRG